MDTLKTQIIKKKHKINIHLGMMDWMSYVDFLCLKKVYYNAKGL